jgi:DNA-binding IscR family transcriptional regulator
MVYLTHKKCALSSEELADNICTNPARVRKVMSALVRAGFAAAREGSEGGYSAAAGAKSLTLTQLAGALGTRFVDMSWRSGDKEKECLVSSGMGDYMDGLIERLDSVCLRELEATTVGDVEQALFRRSQRLKDKRKKA